jgi:hypothetical protein
MTVVLKLNVSLFRISFKFVTKYFCVITGDGNKSVMQLESVFEMIQSVK